MKTLVLKKVTDEDLVFKIIETNNTVLFDELYDRFSKVVYNKCYGFSKSKEEAEDLTHDVFIRLFVKLRTFKGNSKFSTWLYTIAFRLSISKTRKKKVHFFEIDADTSFEHREFQDMIDNKRHA